MRMFGSWWEHATSPRGVRQILTSLAASGLMVLFGFSVVNVPKPDSTFHSTDKILSISTEFWD
jgi:hypothetical protein